MSATFTIVVGDERTSVHVQADHDTEPRHALALAIGCLQAEMADLRNCPAHRGSTEPARCPQCKREGFLHATWCTAGMEDAAGELARFAKTAPGRLPQSVQNAIAFVAASQSAAGEFGGLLEELNSPSGVPGTCPTHGAERTPGCSTCRKLIDAEVAAEIARDVKVNLAACEVERDPSKCWRQPCVDAGQCTAPAGVKGRDDAILSPQVPLTPREPQ